MLYTGTEIIRGSGKGVVVSTREKTEFGKVTYQLQKIETQKTPIQKRLENFSKQLGFIILFMVIIVLLIGFIKNTNKLEMFMTAIALAVSSIPKGLPAVLIISFAISSILMSRKNVIVRKLSAVETLGSVTVICSDKTGTITEERMNVREIFSNKDNYKISNKKIFFNNKIVELSRNKELLQLIKTGVLCNNSRFEINENGEYTFIGDPTEKALVNLAVDFKINKKELTEKETKIKEFEFDSQRKMMSILREAERTNILYSKGAPEKIIEKSSFELVRGEIKKLSIDRKMELLKKSQEMEKRALRVLGFAYKNYSKKEIAKEQGLIFLGFVGMIDPPRKEIKDAVRECKKAGIKIKIITGDSKLTAESIAKEVGIIGKAITGQELDRFEEDELEEQIDEISIFARTTPQQKLLITKILQKRGEIVAITGDDINDVLALKSSNIGISMGIRGTDTARETADIILTDDNFASIVEGVREGRKTYDNIKKFTKYILSVNFSEIFLILAALILGIAYGTEKWYLPLLPLQILWMNLITDSFPALSLVFEKQEDVMKTKPRAEKSLLDNVWRFIVLGGIINFIVCFILYLIGVNNGFSIEHTNTLVLTTGVLFEMFFIYTCRSEKSLIKIGIFSNKWLNYAILFSLILHFILLYTPLSIAFGVIALNFNDWLLVIPFAFSGLIIFEIGKFVKELKRDK